MLLPVLQIYLSLLSLSPLELSAQSPAVDQVLPSAGDYGENQAKPVDWAPAWFLAFYWLGTDGSHDFWSTPSSLLVQVTVVKRSGGGMGLKPRIFSGMLALTVPESVGEEVAQARRNHVKTLLLFRHGKSDWDADYQGDHSRPVAKRGRKAAILMGRFLRAIGQVPDSVITSSALRSRSTVQLAHEAGKWGCPVRVTDMLYDAHSSSVLREIQAEPDDTRRLLIAGHEPTFSGMIGRFVGQAAVSFPTAAMARLDFDTASWSQVAFGTGELVWLVTPKMLKKHEAEG